MADKTKSKAKDAQKLKLKPTSIIVAIVAIVLIILGIVFAAMRSSGYEPMSVFNDECNQPHPEYTNCMPILTEDGVAQCQLAERCGWKVAY